MKNLLRILITIFVFSLNTQAIAEERITEFHVEIKVLKNSDLEITEDITVLAEGRKIKRGIFRDFPTVYKDNSGKEKHVGFDIISVLRDDKPEKYMLKNMSNGKRTYIGRKNRYISNGKHTYKIKFRTNRQLGFFDDYDEIYFNAIGHSWDFSIGKSQARSVEDAITVKVILPEPFDERTESLGITPKCYTGYMGSTEQNCKISKLSNDTILFSATKPLGVNQGFTIAVPFPKGIVNPIGGFRQATLAFFDYSKLIFGLLFSVVAFILKGFFWKKFGKDPKKGAIYPRYEAPENISPAGIEYIKKMGASRNILPSVIVSLAVNKRLKISEDNNFLGLYKLLTLQRLEVKPDDDLPGMSKEENKVFHAIFVRPGIKEVEIKKKNHRRFQKANSRLNKYLKNMYGKYFTYNLLYFFIGEIILLLGLILILQFGNTAFSLIGVAVFIVVTVLYFKAIKAYSVEGRKILDAIEGYELFLKTAQNGRYKDITYPELNERTFEKHLPYAIALGVQADWIDALENSLKKANQNVENYSPAFYSSNRSFRSSSIVSSSVSSLTSSISSASKAPGSRSGSFSGSSGGGGGGGGW